MWIVGNKRESQVIKLAKITLIINDPLISR